MPTKPRQSLWLAPLLAFVLTLASCNSLGTTFDDNWTRKQQVPRVYSGTIWNARSITGHYDNQFRRTSPVLYYPAAVFDVPMSFIMDTLLLPYTLYGQIKLGSLYEVSDCVSPGSR